MILLGWFEQKSSVRCILLCPNSLPINQFETVQQSRQQAPRAYCPIIFTVKKGLLLDETEEGHLVFTYSTQAGPFKNVFERHSSLLRAKSLLQENMTTWDQPVPFSIAKTVLPIYCPQTNNTIFFVEVIWL